MSLRGAHFDLNPMLPEELIAAGAGLDVIRDEVVGPAVLIAKAMAAVEAFETGAYMNSIGMIETPQAITLIATDFKAIWIEYGTHPDDPYKPMHARHILQRALAVLGFRLSKVR